MQNIKIYTKRLVLRTLPPGYAPQVLDYSARNREYFQPWLPRYDEDYFTLSYQKEKLPESVVAGSVSEERQEAKKEAEIQLQDLSRPSDSHLRQRTGRFD